MLERYCTSIKVDCIPQVEQRLLLASEMISMTRASVSFLMPLCKHQVTARYHCSVTSPPGIPGRTGSRSRKCASRTLLSCIPVPTLSVKSGDRCAVRGEGLGDASRRETEVRGAFLTCRARLSNEYAPSANFRPFRLVPSSR